MSEPGAYFLAFFFHFFLSSSSSDPYQWGRDASRSAIKTRKACVISETQMGFHSIYYLIRKYLITANALFITGNGPPPMPHIVHVACYVRATTIPYPRPSCPPFFLLRVIGSFPIWTGGPPLQLTGWGYFPRVDFSGIPKSIVAAPFLSPDPNKEGTPWQVPICSTRTSKGSHRGATHSPSVDPLHNKGTSRPRRRASSVQTTNNSLVVDGPSATSSGLCVCIVNCKLESFAQRSWLRKCRGDCCCWGL